VRRGAKPAKAKVKARRPASGVRGLEKRLAESLEQQVATAEILRIIGTSPMDTQPVFDVIARSAVNVCGSRTCTLFVVDGDMVRVAATHGVTAERVERFRTQFPVPLSADNQVAQVLHERRIFHLADIEHNPAATPEDIENARVGRYRTRLMVPMLRGDSALGLIGVTHQAPTPFSDQQVALLQTFADQAVIAIENVRLFTELHASNRHLTEALDQQTATAEILKVISGTPTDAQPVFDTIVRNAGRVCDAVDATLILRQDEGLAIGAHWGPIGAILGTRVPLTRGSVMGRAIVDARPTHVVDLQTASEFPEGRALALQWGHRTTLGVPLLREGEALGALLIRRTEVRPFSDAQIAMLQTFADQAVIAIENVRLFTELEQKNRALSEANTQVMEALEQQTATSEILGVISSSPTDIQPVFDTLAESAARLCESFDAFIFLRDGDRMRLVANHGSVSFGPIGEFTLPLIPGTVAGRTVLEGRAIHLADIQAEVEEFPEGSETARRVGHRAILSVPLMREGVAIGAIGVRRTVAQLFTDRQVALLQTFADQAVIAIENVRLFKELEARNREVTEALDQKTATSEILGVISSSPTDAQPVFDMIAESAARLCEAQYCFVYRFEGQLLHFVAHHGLTAEVLEINRRAYPAPPSRKSVASRAVLERSVVQIPDVEADPDYALGVMAAAGSYRSAAAVPILRDGLAIGSIAVTRAQAGLLPERQIELLKTFADQAVIAIENVRLFTELREKNEALTLAHAQVSETLEQQTATAEILRVISSSPTDVQPVFDVIVERAVRLCGARFGRVYRLDGGVIDMVAGYGISPVGLGEVQRIFPRPASDDTIVGRVILTRQPVFVRDIEREEGVPAQSRRLIQALGTRSQITIPMLRAGEPIGAMTLGWAEPEAFDEQQIALVKTFADQAVIAIENVRLFTELREKNEALTVAHAQVSETLEQQTATAEILRVISSSPTDVQPVFDAIVGSARRLLGAYSSTAYHRIGDEIHLAAYTSTDEGGDAALRLLFPMALSDVVARTTPFSRVWTDATVRHVADFESSDEPEEARRLARARGYRSMLQVPMRREGAVIGLLTVTRHEPGPFADDEIALLKTFADQAVIAIENVRLFTELGARNRDLTEALEQQTATSEILRVISRSQTDVQPVFDTIVRSAVRLCDGLFSGLIRFDGEMLHHVAQYNHTPEALEDVHRVFPARPTRALGSGRAILERALVHIPDTELDPEYQHQALSRAVGWRSGLFVPMLREGAPIGVIVVARAEPGPFSGSQIELLQTFADQAVIAIENVRLFTELQASNRELTTALDTQIATSDILGVISRSTTDVQPVFDAILESAVRLLRAYSGALTRVTGDQIVLVALTSVGDAGDAALRAIYPQPLQSENPHAQVIRDRAPYKMADAYTDPRWTEAGHAYARLSGYRSLVVVPMLRHDEAIGTIGVTRREPGGFTDDEIALLKTFADQAVIAIENARLLSELQERNEALTQANAQVTEALEQQTATAEILRVISSSPTDVQPVFDTIVRSAVRLCDGLFGGLFRFDGELLHHVAQYNHTPEALEEVHRVFPARPTRTSHPGRAILERAVVHVPDVERDPEFQHQAVARAIGLRSALYVPMLRKGAPIGVIGVARIEPGPFSGSQIELLQTFADQAVIAVENARLFEELQARTTELTRSVDQLTALGEISQAVSSTLDVETVLETIVSRASQLAGADGCAIYEYDHATETFHIRATHNLDAGLVATLRASPLRKGEGAMGRAAETREATQIADIAAPGAYQSYIRDTLLAAGYRALLSVPLLREGEIIGSLSLNRHTPGEFPPEAVEVLKTFATQSALAIQNARLFREIADKSRQLEAASRHKSEFLANMSHELRTPLNAIIGFSEVLNERMFGELNEKQAEYLRDIHASGTHLLSLINDILDLSKVEAGRMELELSDFDLPAAIDSALTLVRERATRRGITLGATVHDGIGEVTGDERKIRQVLLNLLSNAIKFTPEGGRIDVAAVPNGGSVEVSVRDTGVGIAPEDQEAVFEEFRQVGASAAKQEGTGLGLALARKFIELHGGRIWVTSQVGTGSTFTFTLPFRRSVGA
jgi:GAF domain-containing protein